MDRRSLEYFVAIAEKRSFTRAAEALHVSQPALSRAIKSLERELGIVLLDRVLHGVRPTAAGERLAAGARGILLDFEALAASVVTDERAGQSELAGHLRVALTPTLTMEPTTSIVSMMMATHPGVSVTTMGLHVTRDALEAVARGTADVAVVGQEERPATRSLEVELLTTEELMILMPASSELTSWERIPPTRLRDLPFIAEPPGTAMREVLDDFAGRYGLRIVAEMANRQAIVPTVERGAAFGLIPRALARLEHRSDLVTRGLRPAVTIPIWMVSRPNPSPAGAAFAESAHALTATEVELERQHPQPEPEHHR